MGWETSDRASRLPRQWRTRIRPAVLRRDRYRCTWDGADGVRCGWTDPTGSTLEVDHIVRGDDHRYTNLRTLCGRGSPDDHHGVKTAAEAAAGRARRPSRRRPAKPHPGIIG